LGGTSRHFRAAAPDRRRRRRELAVAVSRAKENSEPKPDSSIDIGEDLVRQIMLTLRFGKVRPRVRRQRNKMSSYLFDSRECHLQRLERAAAIGAPIPAEETDDEGPPPEQGCFAPADGVSSNRISAGVPAARSVEKELGQSAALLAWNIDRSRARNLRGARR
jgi:hypothetical protein